MTDSDSEARVILTLAETADLLRIPTATLYKWREQGRGPVGRKVGKYIRYERQAVLEWLRQQPTSAPERADDSAKRVTIRPPRRRAS